MKIVIIGGVSNFKLIRGGIESVVYNLSTQFFNYPRIDFYLLGNKVSENSIGNTHFQNISIPYPKLGLAFNYFFFNSKIINNIEKRIHPDIYHFQGTIPNLLLLNKKIISRTVVTQHGILSEELRYQTNYFRKLKFIIKIFLENYTLPKVKNLIFISNYNKRYVFSKYPKMKDINHCLIYNPVHPMFFDKIKKDNSNFRMYFVGELKKRKGLHDLLMAIKLLKNEDLNLRLEIIGDFIEEDYKNYINSILDDELNEIITFHGWQNKEGIQKISSICNVFILPSYQETLPVSIAEAMALGKAIIATDLPGIREMIQDGKSGMLYKKGDIDELSHKIGVLAKNKNLISRLCNEASYRAKELFNPENILKNTVEFYEKILEKKNET